mmetsp:Transcript_21849/g.25822  ORF Transcript_21849/g.25822 Transcript_21849/m.25822 type:complete len:470 (+) Transcript_21849:82-1491(+)
MGTGGSKLTFVAPKIAPLTFQPKPKDESNKLRRKNSLYEAIVDYLNHLDAEEVGIQELIDEASLVALVAQDKKETSEDPRIAGLNRIADEVRAGNMRALRTQVTNHFKTINRRFQGKHALNSLLHLTAREAYLPMVRTIFDDTTRIPGDREVPIDVNAKNQRGRTPLHTAFGPPTISFNGLKYGLEPGAEKPKCVRPEGAQIDSDWIKPGDLKTRRKVVKMLITEGADYECRDIMDFVPLHYACLWGWDDCVQEFINLDADLATITSTGMTPLMMACSRGHLKVVKLLMGESDGESAELEAKDAQGDTALLYAIRRGAYPVVLLLVEGYGADVNVENFTKDTPLLSACALNHLDMINLLLDYDVDRDPAAFELLRGQVAVMIRARLNMEAGDGDENDGPGEKVRGDGIGAWVVYKEIKPGKKKHKKGTKEPVFYYNTVTRVSTRTKPPDYKRDMLHLPKKAMYGLHFYH